MYLSDIYWRSFRISHNLIYFLLSNDWCNSVLYTSDISLVSSTRQQQHLCFSSPWWVFVQIHFTTLSCCQRILLTSTGFHRPSLTTAFPLVNATSQVPTRGRYGFIVGVVICKFWNLLLMTLRSSFFCFACSCQSFSRHSFHLCLPW